MYTYCTIRFVDDGTEMPVIIKSTEGLDKYDDLIFYYGLSPDDIRSAFESGEIIDGEWMIISVDSVSDVIY